VLGFTRALAAELGKDGVRVNAIGPGLHRTLAGREGARQQIRKWRGLPSTTRHSDAPASPGHRGAAIFLASDLSAYVTGSIVMADGGTGRCECFQERASCFRHSGATPQREPGIHTPRW